MTFAIGSIVLYLTLLLCAVSLSLFSFVDFFTIYVLNFCGTVIQNQEGMLAGLER